MAEFLLFIGIVIAGYIAYQEYTKWKAEKDDDHDGEGGYGVHVF